MSDFELELNKRQLDELKEANKNAEAGLLVQDQIKKEIKKMTAPKKNPLEHVFSINADDIKGDKGDKGDRGPEGKRGEKGDRGPQGKQGVKGNTAKVSGKAIRSVVDKMPKESADSIAKRLNTRESIIDFSVLKNVPD